MARIQMQNTQNPTMEDCFNLFLSATAALLKYKAVLKEAAGQ